MRTVDDAGAPLDLEAARRALEDALRRGASEEEIKRLMDMYEQAIENYLAAQMAEALRNGNVTQGDQMQGMQGGGGQPMGDDELTRMLQALRDLAEDTPGLSLKRWSRDFAWPEPEQAQGPLDGMTISESALSKHNLTRASTRSVGHSSSNARWSSTFSPLASRRKGGAGASTAAV